MHSKLYLQQQEEMSIITYTRILINPVDVSLVQEFRWEWHKVKGHEKLKQGRGTEERVQFPHHSHQSCTSIFSCFPYFMPLPTEINIMIRVQNQIRERPWISSKLYPQNESGLQENFICNYFRASMSTLFSLMFEIVGSFFMQCSCFFKKLFTLQPKMIF